MLPTSPLVDLFVNQTQQANAMPTSPWQQELMATVNPEKMKRQNIAQALAKASQALATTPGNFLTGASAAAGAGANSYLDGQQQNDMARTAAMRQIEEAQRADQDQRLRRLAAAIGIQQGEDNTIYNRGRDAVGDQRFERQQGAIEEDRALRRQRDQEALDLRRQQFESLAQYRVDKLAVDKEKKSFKQQSGGNSESERRLRLDAVYRNLNAFREALPKAWNEAEQMENEKMLAEKQRELEAAYGIDSKTGTMTDQPMTAAPGTAPAPSSGIPSTPGAPGKGDAAAKPKPADALQQARDAIARGANPDAVRQRLIENGYDASGL